MSSRRLAGWRSARGRGRPLAWIATALLVVSGCGRSSEGAGRLAAQEPLSLPEFAELVERISEPGGYFDTDNLISNETGYLNVIGALSRLGLEGGAYVGVGPDQNFSYIAELRPEVAFILDVRRDNLLHHLLLKALIERAPTRLEFLAGLHGRPVPDDPSVRGWSVDEIIEYLDATPASSVVVEALAEELAASIGGYGIQLSEPDQQTIRRFHESFVDSGLSLRFETFGRPPRPYYPTYRQLIAETDLDGTQVSYLSDSGRYEVVRQLHLQNRIIPVVGDLSGRYALAELGVVMREMDVELSALYPSNVEFYLWGSGTFERWRENVEALPAQPGSVLIRSYFPNFGRAHPSAVRGYYSVQMIQPVEALIAGEFTSYWDVVTRELIELR